MSIYLNFDHLGIDSFVAPIVNKLGIKMNIT